MPARITAALTLTLVLAGCSAEAVDPLPSWHDGATRSAITEFVARVTDPASSEFVPVPERIAVFDNDGTRRFSAPTRSWSTNPCSSC